MTVTAERDVDNAETAIDLARADNHEGLRLFINRLEPAEVRRMACALAMFAARSRA